MRSGAAHISRPKFNRLRRHFFLPGFLAFAIGFQARGTDSAPPSPEKAWSPPGVDDYAGTTDQQKLVRDDVSRWPRLTPQRSMICLR